MMSSEQTRVAQSQALRVMLVATALTAGFAAIAAQLIRLSWQSANMPALRAAAPISESYSRPDILDRDGRILARDVLAPSIWADPSKVLDVDIVVESLTPLLPPADAARLRTNLSDRNRRFIWVTRKISPARAQQIHDLGLPGVGYRWETKRTYPLRGLAGHVIGAVDARSEGIAGLERHMDTEIGLRMARELTGDPRAPIRTTLSIAAQHGLEAELSEAMVRYKATAATGLIMNIDNGAIAAAASLPQVNPATPDNWIKTGPIDRLTRGTYELGSVFKIVTAAMGLELGLTEPQTQWDVGTPIETGPYVIDGRGAPGAVLSLHEVIVRSINTGTGRIALAAGQERQRAFLARLGLLAPTATEAGPIARPRAPKPWGEAAVITTSYGHGIAVAPLQFAAAAAALINGGFAVTPTFRPPRPVPDEVRKRVVSARTSQAIRAMLRDVVASPTGTANAAATPEYALGGKTGTADRPNPKSGYDGRSVITSFVGAFPIDEPRFLVMLTLHDPQRVDGAPNRYAGSNVAPTVARVVRRLAPILGVFPRTLEFVGNARGASHADLND